MPAEAEAIARVLLDGMFHVAGPELRELALQFASVRLSARASSTLQKHAKPWERFVDWASNQQPPVQPLAADPKLVALYLLKVSLEAYADNVGPARVLEASAAIACQYSLLGLAAPTDHPLCAVVREASMRKLKADPQQRDALSADDVRMLVDMFCGPTAKLGDRMIATVVLVMYAACLRFDEAAELCVDVATMVFNDGYALLFVPRSKTDQRMDGIWVPIMATGSPYCPVARLRELLLVGGYVTEPSADGMDCGPLLRAVKADGRGGHVLKQLTGTVAKPVRSLSLTRFNERCKQLCSAAGIDKHITAHSCRIGAATEAAQNGASTHLVKVLGRWKSDSMPVHYSKATLSSLAHVARYLNL